MKIDFNYTFKNLDGEVIPERPDEWEEVDGKRVKKKIPAFTLKTACVNVLLMTEKAGMSGEDKVKRYELAKKIYLTKDGSVDLMAEEVSLLKELIAANYPPLTVGQAWEVLDPKEEVPDKSSDEIKK